jgi:hypothetical protein
MLTPGTRSDPTRSWPKLEGGMGGYRGMRDDRDVAEVLQRAFRSSILSAFGAAQVWPAESQNIAAIYPKRARRQDSPSKARGRTNPCRPHRRGPIPIDESLAIAKTDRRCARRARTGHRPPSLKPANIGSAPMARSRYDFGLMSTGGRGAEREGRMEGDRADSPTLTPAIGRRASA